MRFPSVSGAEQQAQHKNRYDDQNEKPKQGLQRLYCCVVKTDLKIDLKPDQTPHRDHDEREHGYGDPSADVAVPGSGRVRRSGIFRFPGLRGGHAAMGAEIRTGGDLFAAVHTNGRLLLLIGLVCDRHAACRTEFHPLAYLISAISACRHRFYLPDVRYGRSFIFISKIKKCAAGAAHRKTRLRLLQHKSRSSAMENETRSAFLPKQKTPSITDDLVFTCVARKSYHKSGEKSRRKRLRSPLLQTLFRARGLKSLLL